MTNSIDNLDLVLFKGGEEATRIKLTTVLEMPRREYRRFWEAQQALGRDDFRFFDSENFERIIPALYHRLLDRWEECKKEDAMRLKGDFIRLRGDFGSRRVWLDGKELHPGPSLKICDHSPDGFNWGYGGSGPSQLAFAICMEFLPVEQVWGVYQDYKWNYIATLPSADFDVKIPRPSNGKEV